MIKVTICWTQKGRQPKNREWILKKFNIPTYMNVNCETPCEIKDEDFELFKMCEEHGAFKIRYKK